MEQKPYVHMPSVVRGAMFMIMFEQLDESQKAEMLGFMEGLIAAREGRKGRGRADNGDFVSKQRRTRADDKR
jgi:hypothetical protein